MEHDDYWRKRFEQLEAAKNKAGAAYYHEVEEQFILAQRQIDKEILSWNQRFATNNGVTMSEAKKMLNAKQLAELRWNVNEYIKYGKENALDGRWMKQLENASARYHISRLEALKLQTQQAIEVLFGNQTDGLDALMRRIYTDGYYHTAFEIQRGFNVGWDIAEIDEARLKKILSKSWAADGKDFSERIWSNKTRLINELHTQLTQCCILGKSPDDAIKNLAKQMNTSKGNARRLVMTESAYFSSAAQRDCFIDLDVEKYEIVATLDSITSTICRALDGKVFETKDYVPGVTANPFHAQYRSCTAPYFDDEFSLGERAAHGEDGKVYYVPSDMRYPEWKKIFVDGGGKNGLKIYDIGGIMGVGSGNKMNLDLLNGAITGALDPDSKEALNHAENYYEAVRNMKTDCRHIAENTGWEEKAVLDIKNHVFMNKHELGRRNPCRFDPDYFMAQSWQRLIDGKAIEEMDYVLLEHEFMELNLMGEKGMSYIDAHELTNQTHNYSKYLK